MTIRSLLEKCGSSTPDALAIKYKRAKEWHRITYGEFLKGVREISEGYGTKFGLKPREEHVALILANGPEWMESYLACSGAGVAVVPMDPKLHDDEVSYIVGNANAVVITTDKAHLEMLTNIMPQLPDVRAVVVVNGGQTEYDKIGEIPVYDYESLRIAGGGSWYDANVAVEEDVASIIYTSGTTGKPKGAMLTHRNFTACSEGALGAIGVKVKPDYSFLIVLPLFHAYAFTTNFVVPMMCGTPMYFVESLRTVGDDIKFLKPSIIMAVPLLAEKMFEKIDSKLRVSRRVKMLRMCGLGFLVTRAIKKSMGGRLRFMIVGGAPCPKVVLQGFKKLGITLLEGYGLTECSPVVSIAGPSCARIGTIGHKLTNIEIRLADQNESGVGELQVKGPIVMKGYWKNDAATAETIDADGWLRTGDLAEVGKDGLITICGRKKALIVNREGKNIYPEEVENCIGADPFLSDCVVIGYHVGNDPGEHVGCIIHPDEDLLKQRRRKLTWEEIERMVMLGVRQRCQKLADYKRPRKVVIVKEALQRTSIQKVRRVAYQGTLDEKGE